MSGCGPQREISSPLIAPHAGSDVFRSGGSTRVSLALRDRTFEVASWWPVALRRLRRRSRCIPFRRIRYTLRRGADRRGRARDIAAASAIVHADRPAVHAREHSLEMQLPFLERLAPSVPSSAVMGYQTAKTASALGDALAVALRGRRALLIASTDLSHLSRRQDRLARSIASSSTAWSGLDPDGLQTALEARPEQPAAEDRRSP